jgi:conjugative transfer pilus assembly protein TraH
MDPPRFSAGCGGIDLFFGSFSFISAEKLTQFVRAVAQNAAPLAFKMAIDAAFPQLGGLLDKFQQMSQEMNSLMKNSCQMAQGLVDAASNPNGAIKGLMESVSSTVSTAKGWADDIADAATKVTENKNKGTNDAGSLRNANGTVAVPVLGNHTWNALAQREATGATFNVASSEVMSKQILMSLIGTVVFQSEGDTDRKDYPPRIRLRDVFRPQLNADGSVKGIPIWSCGSSVLKCEKPTETALVTTGVEGYIRTHIYGSDTATSPQADSILMKMKTCSDRGCGLTSAQTNFLTSVGNVPVLGLLRRTQHLGSTMDVVAAMLFEVLIDEVSAVYGRHVLDTARTIYSGTTSIPIPPDYPQTIIHMSQDLGGVEKIVADQVWKINQAVQYIETANLTRPGVLSYRP